MIRHLMAIGILAFCAAITQVAVAHAWNGGEVVYQQAVAETTDTSWANEESKLQQTIQFIGDDQQVHTASARVTVGKSVRLAYIPLTLSWVISVGSDVTFYHFGYSHTNYKPALIAGTNKMVLPLPPIGLDGYFIKHSDDITENLVPVLGLRGQLVRYSINDSDLPYFLQYQDESGETRKVGVYDQVFSRNKRFGVYWLDWSNFVRVDFKTGEIRAFLQRRGTWYDGIYRNRASGITNDGRYVFMNDGASVVDVQSSCGLVINPALYNGRIDMDYTQCPERYFDPAPATGYDGWHQQFYLAPNERSFSYMLSSYPYTSNYQTARNVTVSVNNTHAGIDYLALGDSYTSGEGDIEKNAQGTNFYLPLTDLGGDVCHVSSRSYPFLLRDYWGIDEANMKSVACSGAQVVQDYYRPLAGYNGQNNRLLGRDNIQSIQQNAIERFIPGRVPQLEFVKKYQPAVITLTGGGNDVGFVDVLKYCSVGAPLDQDATLSEIISEGLYGVATCSFAQKGSDAQKILNTSIASQYQYTTRLIKSIKQTSPETQIYIIGYPSFISEGAAACGNSLELDSQERAMFQYYLRSLNQQLAQAASDENVSFVDIEDSLKGGRLCEGSEYVTGATDILLSGGAAINNMFHPNAKGHQMIAAAIESALANGEVPDASILELPGSVAADKYEGTVINTPLVGGTVASEGALSLNVEPGQFAPNANVTAKLHSDVVALGTITTQSDGAIAVTLRHGTLPVGYHMLTLEGQGADGQPLLLYQFVTVDKSVEPALANNPNTSPPAAQAAAEDSTKKQVSVQPELHFANKVAVDTPLAESARSAAVASAAPLMAPGQNTSSSTNTSPWFMFLFGLCAGMFIMAAWPLIRRARGKAKGKN